MTAGTLLSGPRTVFDFVESGALRAAGCLHRHRSSFVRRRCSTCGREFSDDVAATRHAIGRKHLVLFTTGFTHVVGPWDLVEDALRPVDRPRAGDPA